MIHPLAALRAAWLAEREVKVWLSDRCDAVPLTEEGRTLHGRVEHVSSTGVVATIGEVQVPVDEIERVEEW